MSIKRVIGVLVGAFLLYLSLRDISFKKLWTTIQEADKSYLIIGCFFFAIDSFLKWYKWAYILRSIDRNIKMRDSFSPFVIGLGFNNLVPFKLGEIFKIFLLNLKTGLSSSKIIISIYAEKLYEGTSLFVLLLLSLNFLIISEWINHLVFILLVFFVMALLITYFIIKYNKIIKQFSKIKYISNFIQYISDCSNLLTEFNKIRSILFLSLSMWFFESLLVWSLTKAFYFNLSYFNCLFVTSVLNFGIFIPTSPGSLGTFEFLVVKSLSMFHISRIYSLSFAFVLHTILFVPFIIGSIILFMREGLSFKMIEKYYKRNQ